MYQRSTHIGKPSSHYPTHLHLSFPIEMKMCSPQNASHQKKRQANPDHWISFIHGYSIWQQLSLAVGATTPQFLVYHIKCLPLQLLLPTYLLSRVTTDDGDHSWMSCSSHPWSPAATLAITELIISPNDWRREGDASAELVYQCSEDAAAIMLLE